MLFFAKIEHNIGFREKSQFFRRKLVKIAENYYHSRDRRYDFKKFGEKIGIFAENTAT
jgi:hypothetical protein